MRRRTLVRATSFVSLGPNLPGGTIGSQTAGMPRSLSLRFAAVGPIIAAIAAAVAIVLLVTLPGSSRRLVPQPVSGLSDSGAAAANAVTVSPLPGTPDASPTTQISFLGGPGTKVSDVRVAGSASGSHLGSLRAYSTGTGESFLPATPFVPGEHVRVSARVVTDGHRATVRTDFGVAFQAPVAQAEFPTSGGSADDVQRYTSAPSLAPSSVAITTRAQTGATDGDFFLAPYQGSGRPGPMIVDQSGRLVWFDPLPRGESATNFRPQRYDGATVLTWWQGRILSLGFGQGEDEIYNTSYQPIARVSAGNGYDADLHEFLLTPQGTAWIDAFDPVQINLSAMGGSKRSVVSDGVIQEIDVKTGLVMWEWHALGHVPLRDSYSSLPHTTKPWDYVHLNSIDPSMPGQVLISSRNTCTIFDVNMHSGAFIWRIGGKYPSFHRAPGTFFYYQHDAEWQPGGLVSVFDNGASPDREPQSRGLVLDPDTTTGTVTLVRQFANPDTTLLTSSQGNLANLGDGNWLMGYGGLPNFTEYDASGRILLDASLGRNVQNFRTYLAQWHATPDTQPAIAAQADDSGGLTVEASWNGATAVSTWTTLAGPTADALKPVATVAKDDFETTIRLDTGARYVAVAARDSAGHTLATSRAIKPDPAA